MSNTILGNRIMYYDGKDTLKHINNVRTSGPKVEFIGKLAIVGYNHKLFFAARNDTTVVEPCDVYSYNPATRTTKMVRHIPSGNTLGSLPEYFYVIDSNLFFNAKVDTLGRELFSYNDYKDTLIRQSGLIKKDSEPKFLKQWGSYLYFSGYYLNGSTSNEGVYRILIGDTATTPPPNRILLTNKQNISTAVYPNPTNGDAMLNISLDKAESISVQLVDISGRIVYTKEAQTYTSGKHYIPLPTQLLPAGVYIYQLSNDKGVLLNTGRIVKK